MNLGVVSIAGNATQNCDPHLTPNPHLRLPQPARENPLFPQGLRAAKGRIF